MKISSMPDNTRRVFMVFACVPGHAPWVIQQSLVDADQFQFADQAQGIKERAEKDALAWSRIIGIDSEEVIHWGDPRKFRVLEWGGLEV